MKLQAIWSTKDNPEYQHVLENLKEKFGQGKYKSLNVQTVAKEGTCNIQNRYGTNVYTGVLKEDIQLTELELSMLCDDGYSYFGGSSIINKDRSFKVEIWID